MSSLDSAVTREVADIRLHNIDYNVSIKTTTATDSKQESQINDVDHVAPAVRLVVDVEDLVNGTCWHGEFGVRYVEDMTHKTGNYKKFSVFCRMLIAALRQEKHSVSIDILSHNDLMSLKTASKKNDGERLDDKLATKRYLILTYEAEYDRVHYPLPLDVLSTDLDVNTKRIIERLKEDVRNWKRRANDAESKLRIEEGNHKYEKSEEEFRKLKESCDMLRKERDIATRAAMSARDQSVTLLREKEALEKALAKAESRILAINENAISRDDVNALSEQASRLENELTNERSGFQRHIIRKNREMAALTDRLDELVASEARLKAKCRDLSFKLKSYTELSHVPLDKENIRYVDEDFKHYPQYTNNDNNSKPPKSRYIERQHVDADVRNYQKVSPKASFSTTTSPRRGRTITSSLRASPYRPRSSSPASSLGKRFNPTDYQLEKEAKLRDKLNRLAAERERQFRSPKQSKPTSRQGSRDPSPHAQQSQRSSVNSSPVVARSKEQSSKYNRRPPSFRPPPPPSTNDRHYQQQNGAGDAPPPIDDLLMEYEDDHQMQHDKRKSRYSDTKYQQVNPVLTATPTSRDSYYKLDLVKSSEAQQTKVEREGVSHEAPLGISDIDARLLALQELLRSAKAGATL